MLYSVFSSLERGFRGASPANLSWVLNGYTLVYAAMLIPSGGLSDSYGRKRIFLLGVALFIAASGACGLAPNVPLLVTARVVQAFGAALLTPASLSLVLAAFPLDQRTLTVSLWGAVGGFAAAIGPSLGAYFAQTTSWRWAFFINVPIGLIALAFGFRHLHRIDQPLKHETGRRVDFIGMALLISAVGALALGLTEVGSPTWSRGDIAEVWGISAVGIVAFIAWANTVRAPLIDLSLFRYGTYNAVNLATLTFGIAFSMMFLRFSFT
ncbi:MFS transporter [Robbsia sp. KACC 23696]|uniref:MFS transporter n=1 Tax=Robbsia sp. KACC 23696 TaxID=3149231 RepID=UPI00325C191B